MHTHIPLSLARSLACSLSARAFASLRMMSRH